MHDSLVSVVIPSYNRAYCIEASVRSVLAQTYANLEVVVVDDGSSDNTQEVVCGMGDSRVRYYAQENAGACAARNRGVDLARGSMVAFHDSDDLWLPRKLERQLQELNRTGADFCFCQMDTVREFDEGARVEHAFVVPDPSLALEDLTFERLMARNFVSTQTLVGRRELFANERFDEAMPRMQDWDLVLRLYARATPAYVPEVLVRQTIRADSISSNYDVFMRALRMIEEKHASYLAQNPRVHARMLSEAGKVTSGFIPKESEGLFREAYALGKNPVDLAHAAHVRLLRLTRRV